MTTIPGIIVIRYRIDEIDSSETDDHLHFTPADAPFFDTEGEALSWIDLYAPNLAAYVITRVFTKIDA